MQDQEAEGSEHRNHDLSCRAARPEHDDAAKESLSRHLNELPVPRMVLVFGIQKPVASDAVWRLEQELAMVGVKDRSHKHRDA